MFAFQRGEQIGAQQANPASQMVFENVSPGDGQRSGRNICGIDSGAPECARSEDGEAARPGAQVEHAPRRPAHPGLQAITEKLREMGARHDDATVDVERQAGEPSFVQQVGDGNALRDSFSYQRFNALLPGTTDLETQIGFERQPQATQDQVSRLVTRVIRAVAVMQARPAQAALGLCQQLAERQGRRARSVSR